MKNATKQVTQAEREEGGRRDGLGPALGVALIFSALIHVGLALFFILGPLLLQILNETLEPLGMGFRPPGLPLLPFLNATLLLPLSE